jgi:DNA polymerase-3 subunit beta
MKFIVNKQNFLKALNSIEGIASSREIRTPLGSVLIESKDRGIDMTATDLEMTLRTSTEANILEAGKIMLPARKLSQAVREFRYETMEFQVVDLKVLIHDAENRGRTEIEIMGSPADEFQFRLNHDNLQYVSLPPAMAMEMIDKTLYAVAEDDSRFAFNGLFVEDRDGSLNVVGTDGRRLSFVTRKPEEVVNTYDGIIVPVKAVRELRKLLSGSDVFSMAVDRSENSVHFRLKDVSFISKLIESNYPDYMQVIPKKADSIVRVNREEFRLAIKQASVLAAEPSRQIRLTFTNGEVRLLASTPDVGRAEDTVSCDYTGEPFVISFNSNYLLDVLNALNSQTIEIHLTSSSAPIVIMEENDPDFKAVIMPMRL